MRVLPVAAVCLLSAVICFGWHDPVHALITRAALFALPLEMRQFWSAETDRLIARYCLYPDEYHGAAAERKAAMRPYCEVKGRPIHNVTWKRAEDIESLEYLLANLVEKIRSRDVAAAAQYAGTLAHILEDSTCPAHALTPPDSPLNTMLDLLPPPSGKEDIKLHTVIERSAPEFDLGSRAPRSAGSSITAAAANLLDRTYAAIKSNRADLIELVRASYAGDAQSMDKFRHKASVVGAELLSDAYYTAFLLAGNPAERADARARQVPRDLANGAYLLPNGWVLSPAGRQADIGGLPLRLLPLPHSDSILVMSNGYTEHFLGVFDPGAGALVERVPIKQGWYGLAVNAAGSRVYASAGAEDRILVYRFANSRLTEDADIKLKPGTFAAGIQVNAQGNRIYAAGNLSQTLEVIDSEARRVIASIPVGSKPYTCAISPDAKTAYVSNWGGDSIAVVDVSSSAVLRNIKVQERPNDLLLARDGRLFVANGNRNTISVIDTRKSQVIEQIDIALVPKSPLGSTPNALALSRDGKMLYVANADNNALAVIDVSRPRKSLPRGFIPTGWYPTAVVLTNDGGRLIVADGKGSRSRENATLWKGRDSDPNSSNKGYIAGLLGGGISVIDVPNAVTLARYSEQTHRNSPFPLGASCPIKHIVYIVKENRTYDSVFGDLKEGNGAPDYCLFPEVITPNHHALAREFVLLDNLYHDAEVSADGHHWVTSAYATDYVEKFWPAMYSGRGRIRPSLHDDVTAFSAGGFLWDLCAKAGLSYRSYGEFARIQGAAPGHVRAATASLEGHVHPTYLGPDAIQTFTDLQRLELWLADFHAYEQKGEMPSFQVLSLPRDHTVGTKPGFPTPRAMMAENDYALGQIVEAVSGSRFWKDTAVFVIEDDPQAGPDHVDCHRTVALVASAYTRRGRVDSTMYSSSSLLRTMELILGLPPLTQFDAAATPMWASFQATPDLRPYKVRMALVPLDERNSASAFGARRSMQLVLDEADAAPDDELNEILWKAIKGRDSPMPPRKVAAFVSGR
jgi:YVTN family beta-propeller protein